MDAGISLNAHSSCMVRGSSPHLETSTRPVMQTYRAASTRDTRIETNPLTSAVQFWAIKKYSDWVSKLRSD